MSRGGRGSLRIVAGLAKGRRLNVPKGRRARPTPDRVREAVFSILGESCRGACVVDVCAGTGALGLEALSRGARAVTFIERDRSIAAVLRGNIDRVGLEGATVIESDVMVALRRLSSQEKAFDIMLVDPPYESGLYVPIAAGCQHLLAPGAVVVVEHPANRMLELEGLQMIERRRYGGVAVSFFEGE